MTKFLNISTDNTLGGNSPSDDTVVSQKAIKDYIDGYAMANTSLSNLTPAGKTVCANMAMPSNIADNITIGASGASYTAPADGYVALYPIFSATGWVTISVNRTNPTNIGYGVTHEYMSGGQSYQQLFLPVRKGVSYIIGYSNVGSWAAALFIYAEGAQ